MTINERSVPAAASGEMSADEARASRERLYSFRDGRFSRRMLMDEAERLRKRFPDMKSFAVFIHIRPTKAMIDVQAVHTGQSREEEDAERWRAAMLEFGMYSDLQNERDVRRSYVTVPYADSIRSKGGYWTVAREGRPSRDIPKQETAAAFMVRLG